MKNSNPTDRKSDPSAKDSLNGTSTTSDSLPKGKSGSISDKAVLILKKKPPAITDKELNPEFFQRLQTRDSGDLPVEVVVPRRFQNSSNSNNEEELEPSDSDPRGRLNRAGSNQTEEGPLYGKNRSIDRGNAGVNGKEPRSRNSDVERDSSGNRASFSKADSQTDGSSLINNKGNWLAIQRQLTQLERQQAHLMNMLQVLLDSSLEKELLCMLGNLFKAYIMFVLCCRISWVVLVIA